MENTPLNRAIWAENLRAIATISVVLLHVAAPYLLAEPSSNAWRMGNFFDSAVRFCVPIFVMLTGALMLDRDLPIGAFFAKRFRRVFVPFLAWSGIYIAYHLWASGAASAPAAAELLAQKILRGADYHLWYIYMLLGLYLLLPLLSKAMRQFSEADLGYFLLIWAACLFVQPILERFHSPLDLRYFTGYAGYLVLGHFLKIKKHRLLDSALTGWALWLAGAAITFLGTEWLTARSGQFSKTLYDYLTHNVALQAVGVFLVLKNTVFQSNWLKKVDADSYGIYLSHVLVLNILAPFAEPLALPTALLIPALALVCFGLSWALVWLLKKLPPLREFVG